MSTYSNSPSGSTSQREQKLRRASWGQAPKHCPHCCTPINQPFSAYGNDKPRSHCGADRCRQAQSRKNRSERKRIERSEARARILQYCEQHLDREQKHAVMNMCDLLMQYSHEEGHQIAAQVVQVLEARACKHDRIAQLEEYAAIWKRKATATEQQLKARIEELEAELAMFNALEATIHGIATRQQALQPDPQPTAPEPEPEDPDRAAVLATLALAGIKPIEEALAESDAGYEDPEE